MLGIQQDRVFNPTSTRDANEEFLKLPSRLPSLDSIYTYFSCFLNAYSADSLQQGKLKRVLLENIKNSNYLLELKLDDLYQFQNIVDAAHEPEDDSIARQLREFHMEGNNNNSKLPPYYAQQLVKVLTERPLIYLSTIERVCYDACKVHFNADEREHIDFIQINLLNTFCKPTPIRLLLASKQERFVVVPGIVVQARRPQHKLKTLAIQCRYCDHKMIIDVPLWIAKPQVPNTCRYSTTIRSLRSDYNSRGIDTQLGCMGVKNPYIVLTNECRFVDVQSLKLQELPEHVQTGDMPRHLRLNVTRYLCDKLIPGDRVNVHGVLTSFNNRPGDSSGINSSYLHVLGIEKHQTTGDFYDFDVEETNDLVLLASQPDIHDKIFASIAPAIYGMEHVKRAVACTLFGGSRKEIGSDSKVRGDINVLLLGDPSVAKSQILKFVDKLAPISVYTSGKGSSAAGLTAAVIRDRFGVFSLEGGAMVLADGGIVCIDEFDKMREEDSVAIHEAMEQQTISISKAGITTMLNTRCSVIAAANPSFGSYSEDLETSQQHEFKTTILSRFDLIFLLKDKENAQRDATLCRHILSLHSNKEKVEQCPIPMARLRRLIQYSKQAVSPVLSANAKDSLANFYVMQRKMYKEDKQSATKKIPITLRQLESLVRISESFARMELAPVATEKHVQMAIQLFTVSTAETCKSTTSIEGLAPQEQQLVRQAEEAILSKLPKGQRASRRHLIRDLEAKGYNVRFLVRALIVLIKRGIIEERGDLSLKRTHV